MKQKVIEDERVDWYIYSKGNEYHSILNQKPITIKEVFLEVVWEELRNLRNQICQLIEK